MAKVCYSKHLQGYLAQKKQHFPPRATVGPYAESYGRDIGGCGFLRARYPCTRNLEPGSTWNPDPANRNPVPGNVDPNPESRSPKTGTRKPKPNPPSTANYLERLGNPEAGYEWHKVDAFPCTLRCPRRPDTHKNARACRLGRLGSLPPDSRHWPAVGS